MKCEWKDDYFRVVYYWISDEALDSFALSESCEGKYRMMLGCNDNTTPGSCYLYTKISLLFASSKTESLYNVLGPWLTAQLISAVVGLAQFINWNKNLRRGPQNGHWPRQCLCSAATSVLHTPDGERNTQVDCCLVEIENITGRIWFVTCTYTHSCCCCRRRRRRRFILFSTWWIIVSH